MRRVTLHPFLLIVILLISAMSIVPSVAAVKYKFLSSTMCKNVSEGQCIGETHAFDAKDERAYVLFEVAFTEKGFMSANAEWYYQSGSVEHTSAWFRDFDKLAT